MGLKGQYLSKQWVFEALVKDDKDAVGLIAYALYKRKKHALATNLRTQGKDELTIQSEVNTFHDQTLQNNSLDDYREKAKIYLDGLFVKIESHIAEDFENTLKKLEKQHKAEIRKTQDELLKKIKEYQISNKSLLDRAFHWLLSGIPGMVSSFVVTCLLLGASMLLVSETKRQEVLSEAVSEYFGITKASQSENKEPIK